LKQTRYHLSDIICKSTLSYDFKVSDVFLLMSFTMVASYDKKPLVIIMMMSTSHLYLEMAITNIEMPREQCQ